MCCRPGSPVDRELALVQMLGRSFGLRVELVPVADFARLADALEAGRGDLIAAKLTRTPAREARMRFSRPIRWVREVVVVPRSLAGEGADPGRLLAFGHGLMGSARIEMADGFEVIGEAESGEDGVELAAMLKPDLVLMDVMLPGIDGFEICNRIREQDRQQQP